MANDDKQSGSNLASGSIVLAVLVATGAFLFPKDAPLKVLRPAMTEASIQELASAQTVDARLWQDPIAAVAKVVDKLGKDERGERCQTNPSHDTCKSPLAKEAKKEEKETLVIGVTVSGAPYSEDAEQRRRTRYAVLSGLERAGFVPNDPRRIGYFWLWESSQTSAPQAASLSTVASQPAQLQWSPSLASVQLPLLAFLGPLPRYEQVADFKLSAATDAPFIPYERFVQSLQPDSQSQPPRSILVLWLKEELLRNRPLQKISELRTFLGLQGDQSLKIVGPYSSDILRDMVLEACAFIVDAPQEKCGATSHQDSSPDLKNVSFYAYGASAPDALLLSNLSKADEKVEHYFTEREIQLKRTISTDETLARGIKAELELRHAKLGPKDGDGDLALISEWDTFYGQTLPKAVEAQFSSGDWIYKRTYLRGLDGLTSMTGGADDRKQDKATPQEEKQGGAAGFFKTSTDINNLDRPVGQGQFDYLRRMSKDLHKRDEELRKKGRRLKAIGILGSDVFDKLLVLRALRPEFPEALFFTTDFDEAFTIESELPWTRNLIIASSFGPKLNEKIQREIPAFRSSYQTSAFLATLIAIGNPNEKWVTPPNVSSAIDTQLSTPRIFEISRSGYVRTFAVDPAAAPPRPNLKPEQEPRSDGEEKVADTTPLNEKRTAAHTWGQDSTGECENNSYPWYCDSIQVGSDNKQYVNIQPDPDEERLFPTFDDTGRRLLVWGLAGGALSGLVLFYLRKMPDGARVEAWLVVAGLGAGALTCAFWEPFAQFVTRYGKGEPIAMLEGVSVWPTVLLRILGIVLSIYFIWRAQDSLRNNLVKIADGMKLSISNEAVPGSRHRLRFWKKLSGFMDTLRNNLASIGRDKCTLRIKLQSVILYIRDTIASVFDFSLGQSDKTHNTSLKVETAWRAYLDQERFWSRRVLRASLYTMLMFGFFWFVLRSMLGHPTTPARGDFAATAYLSTTLLDVILMLFLTFFVFDATCFCLLFVNKLRGAKTEWPDETREDFKKRLRLQTDLIHEWIDLEFVAKRTRCIGWLIYYPFVLIALLILSRTTVFANYALSPTILVAQGISLSVVFGCAIMLWWAATAARDAAKHNLTDEIIWAKGPSAMVCIIDAAPTHADSPAKKDDAEQPAIDTAAQPPQQQKKSEDNPRYAEQLETLLSRVEQLRDGAFGPFTQQPLVRAVILPLGSFGWTALIERGMLPGL